MKGNVAWLKPTVVAEMPVAHSTTANQNWVKVVRGPLVNQASNFSHQREAKRVDIRITVIKMLLLISRYQICWQTREEVCKLKESHMWNNKHQLNSLKCRLRRARRVLASRGHRDRKSRFSSSISRHQPKTSRPFNLPMSQYLRKFLRTSLRLAGVHSILFLRTSTR